MVGGTAQQSPGEGRTGGLAPCGGAPGALFSLTQATVLNFGLESGVHSSSPREAVGVGFPSPGL